MSQRTIQATAEELFMGDCSADADISVTFDLTPPERATRNYPGHPGVVELVEWKVDEFSIYDPNGELLVHATQGGGCPEWLLKEIDGWVSSNEQSLIDDACEAEAEASDPYNYY